MSNFELNFFTTAISKHSIFAFPYITSSLLSNSNSAVELIIDNFNIITNKQKYFLDSLFKDRWLVRIRNPKTKNWKYGPMLASIRWVSIPTIKATYTYISDVDILTADSNIAYEHSEHAKFIFEP